MDEPLSNLDAKLRVQTRSEIVKLQHRLGVTTIYVTHDQIEALTMADKIVVMRSGEIQQVGTPQDLFDTPRNMFVAGFIGSPGMNFFTGMVSVENERAFTTFADQQVALPDAAIRCANRTVVFGIRPEHIEVLDGEGAIRMPLTLVESLGTEKIMHLQTPENHRLPTSALDFGTEDQRDAQTMLIRVIDDNRYAAGQVIGLRFPQDKIHVFDDGMRL